LGYNGSGTLIGDHNKVPEIEEFLLTTVPERTTVYFHTTPGAKTTS